MTNKERIEMLVKLYCDYKSESHQRLRNLYKITTSNPDTCSFICAVGCAEDVDKTFVDPILEMLRREGVRCLKGTTDGKTLVTTGEEEFVVDAQINNPFMIEFPIEVKATYKHDIDEGIWRSGSKLRRNE